LTDQGILKGSAKEIHAPNANKGNRKPQYCFGSSLNKVMVWERAVGIIGIARNSSFSVLLRIGCNSLFQGVIVGSNLSVSYGFAITFVELLDRDSGSNPYNHYYKRREA
jgi:hypothetical protein